MQFNHVKLENWRNFVSVNAALDRRVFIVGANALGKSNFLDAFRFLRDIADPQGGFQRAVKDSRGSVSKIRSLYARRNPNVAVEVEIDLDEAKAWSYRLEFTQDNQRQPIIKKEIVRRGDNVVLTRPDDEDKSDPSRLTQTHLEQVSANKEFRQVARFLGSVRYLHLVPQLVRDPDRSAGRVGDPFGGDFLVQLARMKKSNQRQLDSRLGKIKDALRVAVPQLKDLVLEPDERGVPHLKGLYEHWRPKAGWQLEDQFSDGTLRLLGLLWALLDGNAPLLLEEPELSLHEAVVRHIPSMMERVGRKVERQTIVSTHSAEMLSDEGIGAESVLLLVPTREGTNVVAAAEDEQIRSLLEGGMTVAQAVLPRSAPPSVAELSRFAGP
ncbi:MAG TPA: AAA family ATPase [Anaeromyxobacteraceae bacterium]|nr:AAA family ATPase [Anaeromyxobacteraceae bacterium]